MSTTSRPRRERTATAAAPSRAMDVTRIEHENLCHQLADAMETMRRLEADVQRQRARMDLLEERLARPGHQASGG